MINKKIIALAVVAFAFAFAFTASAYDFGTRNLTVGSRGTDVTAVQQALNSVGAGSFTPTGYFGSITKAAVIAFQTNKGITPAVGYFGPLTRAALTLATSGPVAAGSLCPNGMTLASNCMTAPGVVPTVALCPNGMTLASNCTTAPAGVNNSGAPLSINSAQAVSGYLNTAVGVGQVDKQVANIRLVTGAGGAGNLTGINASFYNMGSGDYQFTKYAQSVSVWLNGVKVGTLPISSFSQYNSIYSAFIPVSGAILNANSTNNLVIGVTALPTIDSNNYGSDAWGVDVTSIRYGDSTGVFTYTPSAVFGATLTTSSTTSTQTTYFQFASAASAQSIKLTVVRNVGDSSDSVVVGSSSANTNGVKLAMIDLNAQGDTINLRRLPVSLAVGGSATIPSAVINTLRLYDANGNQLDSQAVTGTTTPATVTFQNLNLNIPVNTTQTLTVKADFNTVGSAGFAAGDTVAVSVSSTNVSNIQAYDSGSNVLSGTTYLTGSTTGNNVAMYVNGINVTSAGATATSVAAAGGAQTHSTVTYTIPFAVTAFGAVAYIPSTASSATSYTSASQTIQFCVDATTACAAAGTGVISYMGSDTMTASAGSYQIPIGQTKNFQLIVTYQPGSAISTRATLENVNWSTGSTAYGPWSTYTSGLGSNAFKTPYAAAQ